MKNAFKKWWNYLIAIGLVGIAVAVAIIPYFAIKDSKVWPLVYISYVCLFSAVVYVGGGFIAQDIFRAVQRKKTNNWDFPLEQKYIDKAWMIFLPFLLAAAVLLLSGLITYPFFR